MRCGLCSRPVECAFSHCARCEVRSRVRDSLRPGRNSLLPGVGELDTRRPSEQARVSGQTGLVTGVPDDQLEVASVEIARVRRRAGAGTFQQLDRVRTIDDAIHIEVLPVDFLRAYRLGSVSGEKLRFTAGL